MQAAETVRNDLLHSLYSERLGGLQAQMAEGGHDEGVRANIDQRIKLVNQQLSVIESYLNSCIFERI